MAQKFELFRLALIERKDPELFADNKITREEYIKKVFSSEIRYVFADHAYHYVPAKQELESKLLIGRIGRNQIVDENRPPAEGLAEVTREQWKASIILVDPTEHQDGQKAAVEFDRDVAAPSSLILGLLRAINLANRGELYAIEQSPIFLVDSFWSFVEKNKGNVTSVRFEFVVPNMLGIGDSITDELRDYREKEKARRVTISIGNPEGIDAETERTREAVGYIEKAGGKINASAKGKKKYSSTERVRRTTIDDIAGDAEQVVRSVISLAKTILGRE